MRKELELWQFIADRLRLGENVTLLVVAESSGSSPGRAGYKMAVAANGKLCGSIGGGVMEVNLVNESVQAMSVPPAVAGGAFLVEQVHQKDSPNASGMICSGRQSVISAQLTSRELEEVELILANLREGHEPWIWISELGFSAAPEESEPQNCPLPKFERKGDIFQYSDKLGPKHHLYIVGGGHCSLALSEMMSRLDFKVVVIDDRPDLNTLAKNDLADRISIVSDYDLIRHQIPEDWDVYVVVMTLGYASDKAVIKQLCDRDFKYFGVLGSKAKMATLIRELKDEGVPAEQLERIRTPIGIAINSRTPEEIAVSIAAEIISVKNAKKMI
ncbi:MAG: XdhC family protein [Pyrinomonadaceae bacterium]